MMETTTYQNDRSPDSGHQESGPLVEITEVHSVSSLKHLVGGNLDTPKRGTTNTIFAIQFSGWALGRRFPVAGIEIADAGTVVRSVPLGVPRPQVAERFPESSQAPACGFSTIVGVHGLGSEFQLEVSSRLTDGSRVPMWSVEGRRKPLTFNYVPQINPIFVTSLGRMGTTWLMRLLGEHPGVVVYRRYPYEMFAGKYWLHMLRVLGEPANHGQSAHPDRFSDNLWNVGHMPFYGGPVLQEPSLKHWLGEDYLRRLAEFCLSNIDDFYLHVESIQAKGRPEFFAEKHLPNHLPSLGWELYPNAREIFLVRNVRDVLCSIIAFNRKRGYPSFGRDLVESDKDLVSHLRSGLSRLLGAWKERASRAHLVKYEFLIEQPVRCLTQVFEYLGLDADTKQVEAVLERASVDNTDLIGHRTSATPEASIGRWRKELSPELIDVCQETLGDLLDEFGYDAS